MKFRLLGLVALTSLMISCAGDKKSADSHSAKAVEKTLDVTTAAKPEKAAINYDIANIKKNSTTDLMQRARAVNTINMEIKNLKRDIAKTLTQLED